MAKDLTSTLEDLIKQYNATMAYTPKTAEQIRAQASGEYQSYYDQMRRATQMQQQQHDLALQQQREGLQRTYDKQREASLKDFAARYSQADRQMLSRGMQRSSYGAQTLANIDLEGAKAQQELWDQQAAAEGNIDAQRTQLAQQLAQQLMGYEADQAADVLARIRQIEDQEYERGVAHQDRANSLSTQLYQILYQAERDKIADQQWQAQFDESVRQFDLQQQKKSGGGSSRKAPTTEKTNPANDLQKYLDDQYNQLMNLLSPKPLNQPSGTTILATVEGPGLSIDKTKKSTGGISKGTKLNMVR